MNKNGLVMVALSRKELKNCHDAVIELDHRAFMIVVRSEEVRGNGFRIYR